MFLMRYISSQQPGARGLRTALAKVLNDLEINKCEKVKNVLLLSKTLIQAYLCKDYTV